MLWTPPNLDCLSPRILYIHGGSWYYCSPSTCGYGVLASKLAAMCGAVVLAIDYPLVPVGNYSSILAHSEQALRWLAAHGPNGRRCGEAEPILFIGGDSSGGGTAASLALRTAAQLRREAAVKGANASAAGEPSTPRVSGTFLFSPWLNLQSHTPSYYHNSYSRRSTPAGMVHTGDIIFRGGPEAVSRGSLANAMDYAGESKLISDPEASPYFAGAEQFDASMYFHITVGDELLTGDSVRFADIATASGATAYLNLSPGMWHVFPMYAEGCGSGQPLRQAEEALISTAKFVVTRAAAALHASPPQAAPASGPGLLVTSVFYNNTDVLRPPWPWCPQRDGVVLFAGALIGALVSRCHPKCFGLCPRQQYRPPSETPAQLEVA